MSNDQTTSIEGPKLLPPKRPTEKTPCPKCGKLGAWGKSKWNLVEHMKRGVCIFNRKTPGTGIERRPPKEGSFQGMEHSVMDGPDTNTHPSSVPYQQSFDSELPHSTSELPHGTSELPHGGSVQPEGLSALFSNNGLSDSNSSYPQRYETNSM